MGFLDGPGGCHDIFSCHSFFGKIKVDAKTYGTLRDFPRNGALFRLVIQLDLLLKKAPISFPAVESNVPVSFVPFWGQGDGQQNGREKMW